ncbi:hypothetical protein GOP47_0026406 [Adiantum capillus-veneris]|nr:hypothetical protein GOP47_0026406 [Adiantum capillus-veneris]
MESEDEYTSQMEDEEHPQTISPNEVIMSPMKNGKGKIQTHIDISSPSGTTYVHDRLMGSNTPRSSKGIPIQLCSSRYGPEISYDMLNLQMPWQENTKYCGYYIMLVMKLLIKGGVNNPHTKKVGWFSHATLETLKVELSASTHRDAS